MRQFGFGEGEARLGRFDIELTDGARACHTSHPLGADFGELEVGLGTIADGAR